MKEKKKWGAEEYLTLVVLTFLAALCLLNARLLFSPVKKLLTLESDFETFTQDVQYAYSNYTAWKTPFVNLNGLFARLTGQRVCNQVLRLDNGMLCDLQPYSQPLYPTGGELLRFHDYLEQKNIPFLYVQAPYKVDMESQLLPEGTVNHSNDDASQLLAALDQQGINVMDLRPSFSQSSQLVEENFFRTDHHWTFTAALRAFPMLLERMDQLLPGRELDMTYAQAEQWQAHTLSNWFLGTWGRRTGVFFGGLDDLTYYTPKFQTQMSRSLPLEPDIFAGDFVQTNMKMDYALRRDFFGTSPYCIYADGNQPLAEHRNAAAPNKLKVLLIEDSFGLPIECFFSTVFTEVNVMDPRIDEKAMDSVMEYVNNTRPDIVVMMITTTGISEPSYAQFGVGQEWMREQTMTGTQTPLFQGDVTVASGGPEDTGAYLPLPVALELGKRYTLRCDGIRLEDGSAPAAGAAAVLRGPEEDSCLKSQVFHLDYGNQSGGFTWSFNIPASLPDETAETDAPGGTAKAGQPAGTAGTGKAGAPGELRLLLYAGLPEETGGVKLTYVNASLTLEE